ncbi:MAG: RdgB/HAM1 family non-canonical purine NTP pyrophosphatase [candidate division WOR-3 bacterium]
MRLLLATRNPDKLKEIKAILNDLDIELIPLAQVAPKLIIPETGPTLEANARRKALTAMRKTKLLCLAEDTGLEVYALRKKPGVYSARYAGQNASYKENVEKLLNQLSGIRQRRARFRTVFALAIPKKRVYLFEGTCSGRIATKPKGKKGFGYDPIFIPRGFSKTFGELPAETKNRVSHRAKALRKVKLFLQRLKQTN